jgi:hypothetical protein
MDEMRQMDPADFDMPNEMQKMAYGGFEVAVEG